MNPWGWQLINGIWYKREDLYAEPVWGVNGSKFRTWQSVIAGRPEGHVVVAGSVHAPTVPAVAVAAQQAGKGCTVIVGGTTPVTAVRHRYIQIAVEAGAELTAIPVGYGPALKKAARAVESATDGKMWNVRPPVAGETADAFLSPVSEQVATIPLEVRTLVIPLGSGNTTAGILAGLAACAHEVERVVCVSIGPRQGNWVYELLKAEHLLPVLPVEIIQLHDWFARYGDRMPENLDGITFHPTYEGKVIRYLNTTEPEWWTRRDGTTGFWIVGGPF